MNISRITIWGIIVLMNLSSLVIAQEGTPEKTQENGEKPNKTIQDILVGIQNGDSDHYPNPGYILDLDVLSYYGLEDKYDTPVKKKVFMKSQEYAYKLSELKEKKAEMLKSEYYIDIILFAFDWNEKSYNVKKGGFEIKLHPVICHCLEIGSRYSNNIARCTPKMVDQYLLSPLPTSEYFFIPMNELDGLDIENNPDKMKIYFIFKIASKMKTIKIPCIMYGQRTYYKEYHYKDNPFMPGEQRTYNNEFFNVPNTNKVRVVIANEETGKVYFDQTYQNVPNANTPKHK